MARLLTLSAVILALWPVTLVAVAPPIKEPARPQARAKSTKAPTRPARRQVPPSGSAEFSITVASEVRLNGEMCRFKDVPNDAVITKIEVDRDTKEVLVVHFSTEK